MGQAPPIDPRMAAAMSGIGGYPAGPGAAAPQGGGPPQPPAGGAGMAGDPSLPPSPGSQMPPGALGGGSPTDQVIWQAFPSTDPNMIQRLVQAAGQQGPQGIMQVLPQLDQMQQQDRDALYQRQQATLQALLGQLMGPSPDQAQQPQAGPAVGGDSGGY